MRRQVKLWLFLIIIQTSCSHYYYIPNTHNIPLFRDKNEFRIMSALGGGEGTNSFELQGAWSMTRHFALSSNFKYVWTPENGTHDEWQKNTYLDIAAGYYLPVSKYGIFEIYGCYGGDSQKHNYTYTNYDFSSGLSTSNSGKAYVKSGKMFIQPAYGFEFGIIDIALSVQFCRLNFRDMDFTINSEKNEYDFNILTDLRDQEVYYFIEPAATIRAGWKSVKIQAQASMGSYQFSEDIPFEPFHFSVGLLFSIGERFRDKDDEK